MPATADELSAVSSHRMHVSRTGQVSIPAEARRRWGRPVVMVVLDLGTHVVMRPAAEDPVAKLRGKYAGRLPSTDKVRAENRADERAREQRRRRR